MHSTCMFLRPEKLPTSLKLSKALEYSEDKIWLNQGKHGFRTRNTIRPLYADFCSILAYRLNFQTNFENRATALNTSRRLRIFGDGFEKQRQREGGQASTNMSQSVCGM
jgi:hypothetical protein